MSTSQSNKIGVSTATIVGMNAMIGAAIFATPSVLAGRVGPAAILTYAFVAVSVWFMAQSIARVAQLFPQEGSFYTYARQWGGHHVGLLASGAYLVGLLIAMGLLAHAAGDHLVHYFPTVKASHLGVITLASLTLLNVMGVSLSSLGQQILIVLTVFPLLATTVMCLTKADINNFFPFVPYGPMSILDASRFVAFGFFGFEASASLFNVIRDPEKNLPKALTYSLICVAVIYLAFVASLIAAVPLKLFIQNPGPVSGPLSIIFPNNTWLIECIHISSISAILGTLHSMIWSSGALLLTFTKKLRNKPAQYILAYGIMNQRVATLLIGGAIFTSFALLHNMAFFNLTALFMLTALSLSMITLLFIESEWKSGQNYITIAGLLTASVMVCFALASILGY